MSNTNVMAAGRTEQCFYEIGMATTGAELRRLEKSIPSVTADEDERAELLNAILDRFGVLNAEAVGLQKVRWN